jgi:nitrile hydratase accessory protein
MTDDPPEPGEETPTFAAPWQARAFALAVALTDERDAESLTWDEFQSRLVAAVDADPEGSDVDAEDPEAVYYRQWLTALERLLVERDVLDPGELLDRIGEFEAGDHDAHEFVAGDPHAHADRLPEGHADGSGHGHDQHDHGHGHEH